jgi:hypothetical protein
LKAEQFDDIDFDHIVTDEAMKQFLGYSIPENKKMMTKRGKAKKKGDAPTKALKFPKQLAKKRTLTSRPWPRRKWPQRRKNRILLWQLLSRGGCLR